MTRSRNVTSSVTNW